MAGPAKEHRGMIFCGGVLLSSARCKDERSTKRMTFEWHEKRNEEGEKELFCILFRAFLVFYVLLFRVLVRFTFFGYVRM